MDYPKRTPLRRNPTLWLQMTLLIGFIFCLLVGVGALTAMVLIRALPAPTPTSQRPGLPSATIMTTTMTPHYALRQLAGDPAEALAFQALPAGELDLAAAIAFYTVELSDHFRLPLLLQLGRRYQITGQLAAAQQSYTLARTVAVTTPDLSYLERSQALLQIADGLAHVGASAEATDAANQALLLAEQTPDLLPAQRSQTAEALVRLAEQLQDNSLRSRADALVRDPFRNPGGALLQPGRQALAVPITPDPELEAAVLRRRQAALVLIERLQVGGGLDFEPERQALSTALLNEERIRLAVFQRTIGVANTPGQQLTILEERRAWTALKLRIAYGAFGLELVPEWSGNPTLLLQEYAAVASNMLAVAEAAIAGRSDPVEQVMLRIDMHLWLAQQVELGLVADRNPLDLDDRLRFYYDELARLGTPISLPVRYAPQAVPPGFRIATMQVAP